MLIATNYFALNKENCYDKAYEVFLRCSNLHDTTVRSIEQNLPTALNQMKQKRDKLNVLSIGSGSGEMDHKILEIFLKNVCIDGKITNTAVEPHGESIQQYQYQVKHGNQWKSFASQVDF